MNAITAHLISQIRFLPPTRITEQLLHRPTTSTVSQFFIFSQIILWAIRHLFEAFWHSHTNIRAAPVFLHNRTHLNNRWGTLTTVFNNAVKHTILIGCCTAQAISHHNYSFSSGASSSCLLSVVGVLILYHWKTFYNSVWFASVPEWQWW